MMKLDIILCDDDSYYRDLYVKLLHDNLDPDVYTLHLFSSAIELLKNIELIQKAQLAILDICMENMNGIHVAEVICNIKKDMKIVFLSSSSDYVFDCFHVNPVNYFIKDCNENEKFIMFIKELIVKLQEEEKIYEIGFSCNKKDRSVILRLHDIIAFEAIGDKVNAVHSIHGDYTTRVKLQELYLQFHKQGFEKANRSCVVNMEYISRIEGNDIYMARKYIFPITNRKVNDFKAAFKVYLLKNEHA